ncbi:hypothetical protein Y09_1228 [Brachybacterium sp. SW0106-09]|nr:hypothetical protein Y09_1228 [Brachybacterium sp. SW0106-09]
MGRGAGTELSHARHATPPCEMAMSPSGQWAPDGDLSPWTGRTRPVTLVSGHDEGMTWRTLSWGLTRRRCARSRRQYAPAEMHSARPRPRCHAGPARRRSGEAGTPTTFVVTSTLLCCRRSTPSNGRSTVSRTTPMDTRRSRTSLPIQAAPSMPSSSCSRSLPLGRRRRPEPVERPDVRTAVGMATTTPDRRRALSATDSLTGSERLSPARPCLIPGCPNGTPSTRAPEAGAVKIRLSAIRPTMRRRRRWLRSCRCCGPTPRRTCCTSSETRGRTRRWTSRRSSRTNRISGHRSKPASETSVSSHWNVHSSRAPMVR